MDLRWTIEELARRVAEALASTGTTQTKRQVSEAPTVRTIRYYADLGLLDPPAARHGLWAMYDERHLVQLLAIKRLQADGWSLDEIRARLASTSPRELRQLGRVETRTSPQQGLLIEQPQHTSLGVGEGDGEELGEIAQHSTATPVPPTASTISPVQGIRLRDDVAVLFPATNPLTEADLEALRVA